MGVSVKTIEKLHEEKGDAGLQARSMCGRKRKTTEEEDRGIVEVGICNAEIYPFSLYTIS